MKNKKISTDFFNYGTYKNLDADILKKELEKQGIPVKVIYPGTNIGRDATAGAYFTAYKLMIRACDFQRAEKIRNNFNIISIGPKEPMPLPKIYKYAKNTPDKIFLIGTVFFLLTLLVFSGLGNILELSIDTNTLGYLLMAGYFVFASLLISSLIYRFFKDWFKKNKTDKERGQEAIQKAEILKQQIEQQQINEEF